MRRWLLATVLAAGCKSAASLPPPQPLPKDASFAGDWESSFGRIRLDQRDNWLFGGYGDKGSFFGSADGDQMRFNWRDNATGKWGKGYFVMSRDGQRMDGQYGAEDAETGAGVCWARRAGAPAPVVPAPTPAAPPPIAAPSPS